MSELDPWLELEAEPGASGRTRRRLYPSSSRDLFIEYDRATTRRMFTYVRPWGVDRPVPRLQSTRALNCLVGLDDASSGYLTFSVILEDSVLKQVFVRVVEDLAETAALAADDEDALAALINRVTEWQTLFQGLRDSGLPASERRGLFGELLVLRDHLIPTVGPSAAMAAWTGPLRANQDFQLARCAVEVKTTVALQPHGLTVNNERELEEPDGGVLMLVQVSLDERQGSGTTLFDLVDELRAALGLHPVARQRLDSLLLRVGYLDEQRDFYNEPHYSLRAKRFFDVVDGFPRITERDLAEGVGKVTYRVTLAACAPFEISEDLAMTRLTGTTADE